jgi:hypothetical protein
MQSFNQPSEEEHKQETVEEAGRNEEMETSSPLYEFPAGTPVPAAAPDAFQTGSQAHVLAGDEHVHQPSEEDIRRGLVYPPPPSYYQNLQVPQNLPPLPQPQAAIGPAQYPHQAYVPQPPVYPAGFRGTQTPPFPPPQLPPVRKSRRWVWIIVSIFIVAFLVSCGLCSWAFYSLFNTTFQQVSGATNVAQEYYKDIQNHDYADAYKFLQITNLTQADFTQQAQSSDTQNGVVQSFIAEQPTFTNNPSTGPNLSQWRITVDVTREKTSYPVLLTVQQSGNTWEIIYFDKI